MSFRVLFVCTGNICRSPTGERLLRHALAERLGSASRAFVVESAGTGALVGEPIQPDAAALVTVHGADVSAFAARQLERPLIEQSDLVLAMTRNHRAWVATEAPSVLSRLFTLREFARLAASRAEAIPAAGDPVERARAVVQLAVSQRGLVRAQDPSDDDVPDPYGRPAAAYQRPYELIRDAVDTIADLLAPEPTPHSVEVPAPAGKPYRHIVLFRMREGAGAAALEAARAQLLSSIERAAGVVSSYVGLSLDTRNGTVLVQDATFADRAAFDDYRQSTDHARNVAVLSQLADWVVGDYETEDQRGDG